ncbi:hybrid sensor histidine kinase/response regulator [Roseateles amylovorans]|uniref:histidine kinase n=1 Tax=Roseateles amylovorans TaxID=2978473 RepID=A0ABY6B5A0_9BURK|nr:response regulator [Roseateles amylovorans]UXH80350.1 response regulator [Roseateles amylovorans]
MSDTTGSTGPSGVPGAPDPAGSPGMMGSDGHSTESTGSTGPTAPAAAAAHSASSAARAAAGAGAAAVWAASGTSGPSATAGNAPAGLTAGPGEPAGAAAPLEILLLEDSAFDAELLQASLDHTHPRARVTWVKDEAGLLGALETQRFDLILSDYQLAGFNGAEALTLAQLHAPGTPFIFVSGVIGEENTVELLKRGATDYVMKGRLTRLSVAIDRALREVRQREAQRLVEAQLREADALYARVVDSLQEYAVILLDTEGRIRDWNQAASSIFGHTLDEVRGRSAELLLTPEDRAAGVLDRQLAEALTQGSARDDRWLMRQNGGRLRAEGAVTPLYSVSGEATGFSKIIRDITPAFEAREALRLAKEEAERASELKDQFLAVLSHELRSPLSAITGWADILNNFSDAHPLLGKASTVIRRNAQLQARMINDLLDMSAVVAGKLRLQTAPLDLANLASETVLGSLHEAQGKGVALNCHADGTVWINGDVERLSQVIANLVGNAIKFTDRGGRVNVEVHVDGTEAVLRVSDTGRGISPAFLPYVFDRLRQEDGSFTRKAGGLGLGLAIARAIAELHQGQISAHSPGPGCGACFELRLPVLEDCALPPPPATGTMALSDDSLAGVRVLLVDDEEDAREVGQVALSRLGAKVRVAGSAAEALAVLNDERFDLLVSDIGMPDMDGRSLIREVRRMPGGSAADLPAVALTAFAMVSDRQEGLAAGFQGYVAKPIELGTLTRAIREALDGRTC